MTDESCIQNYALAALEKAKQGKAITAADLLNDRMVLLIDEQGKVLALFWSPPSG